MIPAAIITGWSQDHPWSSPAQVEQDLILSRALVQIFRHPVLKQKLVFRGGTALHKLHMAPATRYSEDLDFVQISEEGIGEVLDVLREELNPWLGNPRSKVSTRGSTLTYRFQSEAPPVVTMRLKIEINTREHFHVYPLEQLSYSVDTRWFSGVADIHVYTLDELLGTKLRALYQRRKGRDLFDIWHSHNCGLLNPRNVVDVFSRYMQHEGHHVTRNAFEENLQAKIATLAFSSDTPPLLRPGIDYSPKEATAFVMDEILSLLD